MDLVSQGETPPHPVVAVAIHSGLGSTAVPVDAVTTGVDGHGDHPAVEERTALGAR